MAADTIQWPPARQRGVHASKYEVSCKQLTQGQGKNLEATKVHRAIPLVQLPHPARFPIHKLSSVCVAKAPNTTLEQKTD